MEFENTKVMNFDGAIRGLRNPLESWARSDSKYDENEEYIVGQNDLGLMQRLLKASMAQGNSHSKFMRQILVCVDITAPMYWYSEFDTYKVGTVANSTSKMHFLAKTPITMDCFETDDYEPEAYTMIDFDGDGASCVATREMIKDHINWLETLRKKYFETKDQKYWKELLRWLPESWLQTRTVTLNYQVLRQMYFDRRYHKLTEWSKSFVEWIKTLPYAEELIMYEGDDKNA